MCLSEIYVYLIFSLRCDIRYVVEDISLFGWKRGSLRVKLNLISNETLHGKRTNISSS
jgi:hypothetical protein